MMKNGLLICLFLFATSALTAQTEEWKSVIDRATEHMELGEIDVAIGYAEKGWLLVQKEADSKDDNYLLNQLLLTALYYKKGRYKDVSSVIDVKDRLKQIEQLTEEFYFDYIDMFSDIYIKLNKHSMSISLYNEILKDTPKNHENYSLCLYKMALVHNDMGEFDKAKTLLEDARTTIVWNFSPYNRPYYYAAILYHLGCQYVRTEENYAAIEVFKEGQEITGFGVPLYFKCAIELGRLYKLNKNYSLALSYYIVVYENQYLSVKEKGEAWPNNLLVDYPSYTTYEDPIYYLGKEDPSYLPFLSELAELYLILEKYSKSLDLYNELLEKTDNLHLNYVDYLIGSAQSHFMRGYPEKAIYLYIEARKNVPKEDPRYLIIINELLNIYNIYEMIEDAIVLCENAIEITEYRKNENNSNYYSYKILLANWLLKNKEYIRALDIFLSIASNINQNHSFYFDYIQGLALAYYHTNQSDLAIPLQIEFLEGLRKSLGESHIDYVINLVLLSKLYCAVTQFDNALIMSHNAVENSQKLAHDHYIGTNDEDRIKTIALTQLAYTYSMMKCEQDAIDIYIEAIKSAPKTGSDYPLIMHCLWELYRDIGELTKAEECIREYGSAMFLQFDKVLSYGSQSTKESYASAMNNALSEYKSYCRGFPNYNRTYPQEVYSKDMYDIELATKEMVLRSSIQLRQYILNSADTTILKRFDEWQLKRANLARYYSHADSEDYSDKIKEMEHEANVLEEGLNSFEPYSRYTSPIGQINCENISSALDENDVAIEFSCFHYYNGLEWTDSSYYFALVLRSGDKYPRMIQLFEQRQLDSLFALKAGLTKEAFFRKLYHKRLYELVWQPLDTLIPAGANVYFAPSGSLHQIAFAAITYNENILLSDRYHLHQVSTTAMLLQRKEEATVVPSSMALFGGIRYDADYEDLLAQASNFNSQQNVSRSLPQDLERGNEGWDYLQYTLREVNNIDSIAKKKNIATLIFKDVRASEEQIKQLAGGKSPQVLHIATHGFFFPDPQKKKPEDFRIIQEERSIYKISDNPLNRAGLLFAGANRTWKGETMNGIDDGILTAYEVNCLYLGNTKLVVLSACETGLGDIKGSEGVFGLQRAFKAAGAEFLLMSLWKVPDIETAEFMRFFYQGWFSGQTITQAFHHTQNEMKKKYPYASHKWAAFVLVK